MARETFSADDPRVVLNSPSAGRTTITFNSLTYTPGTNELLGFHNGIALVEGVNYTESGVNTVIVEFLPDITSPDVDSFMFQTIVQGSSEYIPPPATFAQAEVSRRPDNFSGRFVFDV